jgi:hypothetical protein
MRKREKKVREFVSSEKLEILQASKLPLFTKISQHFPYQNFESYIFPIFLIFF